MHATDAFGLAMNLMALGWSAGSIAEVLDPESPAKWVMKIRKWRLLTDFPRGHGESWMQDVKLAENELYDACMRVAVKVLGRAEEQVDQLTGPQALDGLKKLVDVMSSLRNPAYAAHLQPGGVFGGVVSPQAPGTGSLPGTAPQNVERFIEATLTRIALQVRGREGVHADRAALPNQTAPLEEARAAAEAGEIAARGFAGGEAADWSLRAAGEHDRAVRAQEAARRRSRGKRRTEPEPELWEAGDDEVA